MKIASVQVHHSTLTRTVENLRVYVTEGQIVIIQGSSHTWSLTEAEATRLSDILRASVQILGNVSKLRPMGER